MKEEVVQVRPTTWILILPAAVARCRRAYLLARNIIYFFGAIAHSRAATACATPVSRRQGNAAALRCTPLRLI